MRLLTLAKPWIFTEIAERREWDISSRERLELIRQYCEYGLKYDLVYLSWRLLADLDRSSQSLWLGRYRREHYPPFSVRGTVVPVSLCPNRSA